jgi:hypothetical protein
MHNKNSNTETPEDKAKRIGVPVIPVNPHIPTGPNPTVSVCGKCGMEIKQVMHYVCNIPDCPVFLQIR